MSSEIKVINISKDDTNQIISMTFLLSDFSAWDHIINESAFYFKELTGHLPNIMLANDETLGKLDRALNIKLNSPFNDQKNLDVFISQDFKLQVCLGFELKKDQFQLIIDEQASFIYN